LAPPSSGAASVTDEVSGRTRGFLALDPLLREPITHTLSIKSLRQGVDQLGQVGKPPGYFPIGSSLSAEDSHSKPQSSKATRTLYRRLPGSLCFFRQSCAWWFSERKPGRKPSPRVFNGEEPRGGVAQTALAGMVGTHKADIGRSERSEFDPSLHVKATREGIGCRSQSPDSVRVVAPRAASAR
jgi:hypothetical protein